MASLPDAGDWSDSPVPPQGSGAGTGTDDVEEMEVMDGATLANNDEDSSVEVVVPPEPEDRGGGSSCRDPQEPKEGGWVTVGSSKVPF